MVIAGVRNDKRQKPGTSIAHSGLLPTWPGNAQDVTWSQARHRPGGGEPATSRPVTFRAGGVRGYAVAATATGRAALTLAATTAKASGCFTASSAKLLRSSAMLAALSPAMNWP